MQVGVHLSLWTDQWDAPVVDYIDRAAQLGFDCVEIPLTNPEAVDVEALRDRLACNGISAYCGTGLGPDTDITSESSEIRARGRVHLARCLDIAHRLGSPTLGGVIHSAWGKREPVHSDARKWAVQILREAAEQAAEWNMRLALECINRYENSFVNTVSQGLCLIDQVGMPNVGLHLDTYHMNIEERSVDASIESAGQHLYHIHLSESDRGYPGGGNIQWDLVFSALRNIGYQGSAVIESYVRPGVQCGTDVCIWRAIEPDIDESLTRSLEFVRSRILRAY
jgi:D-psicose/D-tagatose/L-ribulose 3-epimerase